MSHTKVLKLKEEMIDRAHDKYGDEITLLPKMANGEYHNKDLKKGFTVIENQLTLWFNDGFFTHAISENIVAVTQCEN